MPPVTFDIWDQAALTAQIRRKITTGKENLPSLGDVIAPLQDVRERKLKFRIIEVDAFGIGQLRAPDGDPKLWRTSQRVREEMIELALPDEMERISEDILDRLDSTDENIRLTAGADVVTRGAVLAARSWRRVERMRWDAFLKGYVDLDYDDSGLRLTYDIPNDHFVTAGTLWTDTVNADIVSQLRGWQKKIADDVGAYGTRIYMNSDTWELVSNNAKIAAKLSSWGRSLLIPSGVAEVASLLRGGQGDVTGSPSTQIIIYDGGYRDVGSDVAGTGTNLVLGDSTLTKWIPYGKVLITTEPNLPETGEQIADTPNGRVRVATGYNSAVWKQGPAAETILHPISKNEMLRYARANIPRILIPEAFLVATVV